jgi:hypothetical protein
MPPFQPQRADCDSTIDPIQSDRDSVTAFSTDFRNSATTKSKGSSDLSARDRAIAPSQAEITSAAIAGARELASPASANRSRSRARQVRNTSAAPWIRTEESVATVTATTAQPAGFHHLGRRFALERAQIVQSHVAGRPQRSQDKLLAAWKVMIERTPRCARCLQNLAERCALEALLR